MLVSAIHQHGSAIGIHMSPPSHLPPHPIHFDLLQDTEYINSSLRFRVGPCCLHTLSLLFFFLLEYNCFTVLVSAVQQSESAIYILSLLDLPPFPLPPHHLGQHRAPLSLHVGFSL